MDEQWPQLPKTHKQEWQSGPKKDSRWRGTPAERCEIRTCLQHKMPFSSTRAGSIIRGEVWWLELSDDQRAQRSRAGIFADLVEVGETYKKVQIQTSLPRFFLYYPGERGRENSWLIIRDNSTRSNYVYHPVKTEKTKRNRKSRYLPNNGCALGIQTLDPWVKGVCVTLPSTPVSTRPAGLILT